MRTDVITASHIAWSVHATSALAHHEHASTLRHEHGPMITHALLPPKAASFGKTRDTTGTCTSHRTDLAKARAFQLIANLAGLATEPFPS